MTILKIGLRLNARKENNLAFIEGHHTSWFPADQRFFSGGGGEMIPSLPATHKLSRNGDK
jgi:hypothetical protein